ncbi:hypothetical protein COZ14_02775, partial [Candidatus Dojkabacteria bacterium CG_4_10_14_3_um_filter_Dojkabacteria_WS6_41_9]
MIGFALHRKIVQSRQLDKRSDDPKKGVSMKLRIAIPALILFVAMLACSLPTAGTPAPGGVDVVGTAVVGTAQAASLATAQALPSPTAFQPVANNTEVPLPTIIPTAQCTSVYSTYKVDIVDGNFVFGPWDSDLALAQWPGVGVGLAWAQWRGICKLDFVYDAQMQHAFVVVHKGEADEPAVKELYST